jgi:hypothetical protein
VGREFEEMCDELNEAWGELEAVLKRFHASASVSTEPGLALAFRNGRILVEADGGPQPVRSVSLDKRIQLIGAVPSLVQRLEDAEMARLDQVAEAVDSLRDLVAGLADGHGVG